MKLSDRLLLVLIPAVMVLGVAGQSGSAPGQREASDWTFNFPVTPLRIGADSERSYILENKSEVAIKKYRLGCVQLTANNNPKIVLTMESEEYEIAPGKSWGVQAFHRNPDRASCDTRKAKLSVVEVWFANGKAWHALRNTQ